MLEWALQMIVVLVDKLLDSSLRLMISCAFVDNEMARRNDLGEKDTQGCEVEGRWQQE